MPLYETDKVPLHGHSHVDRYMSWQMESKIDSGFDILVQGTTRTHSSSLEWGSCMYVSTCAMGVAGKIWFSLEKGKERGVERVGWLERTHERKCIAP